MSKYFFQIKFKKYEQQVNGNLGQGQIPGIFLNNMATLLKAIDALQMTFFGKKKVS